jgi:biopolymer transport protein ExbD
MAARPKNDVAIEPTLPITPMLDMAFQLLAFFIFTYNPSDLEGQMDLSLPSEAVSQADKKENVDPMAQSNKTPLELPADLTIIIRTQRDGVNDGAISALTVEDRSGKETIPTPEVEEAARGVTLLDKLRDKLKKAHGTVENKESIKIQGDGKLKWDSIVKVMDVCRDAGFNNISFVPPPDFRLSNQ